MGLKIKAGDIGFVRGGSRLGRIIRWFEREKGEEPTWPNHVLTFTRDGDLYTAEMVEAQWHVQEGVWYELHGHENCELEIWRVRDQTAFGINREIVWLRRQVGNKYGWWKLLLIAGQRFLSLPLKKAMFVTDRPICSILTALGKNLGGIYFDRKPMLCTPDNLHDYVVTSPDWIRVAGVTLNKGAS
jgi:hypothetical protein